MINKYVQNQIANVKRELLADELAEANAAIQDATAAREAYEAVRITAIQSSVKAIVKSHDFGIAINQANLDLISRWLFHNRRSATAEDIAVAVQNLTLAPKPPSDEEIDAQRLERLQTNGQDELLRDELVKQIMELLVASKEEKARERSSYYARFAASPEQLQNRHKTGAFIIGIPSLFQRLVNLKESARLRSLSHEELREEVRQAATPHAYALLPRWFTPFQISGMSAAQFKQMVRKYGIDAINARIAEQSAKGEWEGIPVTTQTESGLSGI